MADDVLELPFCSPALLKKVLDILKMQIDFFNRGSEECVSDSNRFVLPLLFCGEDTACVECFLSKDSCGAHSLKTVSLLNQTVGMKKTLLHTNKSTSAD